MDLIAETRERELIRRAKLGDEGSLGALIDLHASSLVSYIAYMTGDFHQAEDLAQETFLRAFDNLSGFDINRPFRPWLMKIGRNLTLNYLSTSTAKERRTSPELSEPDTAKAEMSPEDSFESAERRRGVQKVLSLLPVHFREILHLRYMEQLEYDDIAKQLDLPLGTVKTWLFRAKAAFLKEARESGIGL